MSNQDKFSSYADALSLLRGWHSSRAILQCRSLGPKGDSSADCFMSALSTSGIELTDIMSGGSFFRIIAFDRAIDFSVFIPSGSSGADPQKFRSGLQIKMIDGEQIFVYEYRKHSVLEQ